MKNKKYNYLRYSGIGFQIVGAVLIGVFSGQWLDKHFETNNNIFTLILSALMIVVVVIQLIRLFK